MPKVQYARVTIRNAYLSGEFGESYARKLFGDVAVDALPRISRGKRKGALKGNLTWQKCEVGGWHRGLAGGGVVWPGFVSAEITIDGRAVLQTTHSSFAKLQAAEAAEAAAQAEYRAKMDDEQAEITWAYPGWPKLVDYDTRMDDKRRLKAAA